MTRPGAYLVSQIGGRPAFGGTPSDLSVVHLIAELKARGLKITFYPFLVMDIPSGNALPDPWTGASSQPAYPWRGRITCDPAPGQPGSPQGTSAAAAQVANFFSGGTWNYRRMILHYANLVASAGGVDAFLIGSELKALTRVRSGAGVYPAVDALVTLAADVKAIVGSSTLVTYGADWTEYGADVVDASESALSARSVVGIVGDRRGRHRLLCAAGGLARRGGASRLRLLRRRPTTSAISAAMSAPAKATIGTTPTMPRARRRPAPISPTVSASRGCSASKDIWNWWSNLHYERVAHAELVDADRMDTALKADLVHRSRLPRGRQGRQPAQRVSRSEIVGKPPAVFFQRRARRSDSAPRAAKPLSARSIPRSAPTMRTIRCRRSMAGAWSTSPRSICGPGTRGRIRCFPRPATSGTTGRTGRPGTGSPGGSAAAPLDALVGALLDDAGVDGVDTSGLRDGCDGYVVDRPMSPRAMIEPLAMAYAFDATAADGTLRFIQRGGAPVAEIFEDDLVLPDTGTVARLTRAQETELPREASFGFTDAVADYRRSAVTSRKLVGAAGRTLHSDLAVITNDAAATPARGNLAAGSVGGARERRVCARHRTRLRLAPGDVVALTLSGRRRLFEIGDLIDTEAAAGQGAQHRSGSVFGAAAGAAHKSAGDSGGARAGCGDGAGFAGARFLDAGGADAAGDHGQSLAGLGGDLDIVRRREF